MRMVTNLKYLLVLMLLVLWACKDTPSGAGELVQPQQQADYSSENDYILPNLPPVNGSIILEEKDTILLTGGLLTNLVSENFQSGDQNWYCYQLKLAKLYPVHLPDADTYVSYSITFKFFSEQDLGVGNEEFTIQYLDGILPYYKAMNQNYATEKKTIAFLNGDRTFDPSPTYDTYRDSQIRISSGDLQITKSGELYQVAFVGETETGETVVCRFNDALSLSEDNSFESNEEDFSLMQIQESYIQKNEKYYKLDDGQVYFPNNSQENTFRVLLRSDHNYYRYESNGGSIVPVGKQNAIILQFQLENFDQFKPRTYRIVPSEVNTGADFQFLPTDQVTSFPNDSLCIGFYHLSVTEGIEWMSQGYSAGFTDYFVLQSGELEVVIDSSEYEITGSFVDNNGDNVIVKFKATWHPEPFPF